MPVFVMLTRISPEAVRAPKALEELEKQVMARIREQCPTVEWLGSYAVLGPHDYVDIFRADGVETATKVSTLIRTFGHAQTEIWAATEWDRFKDLIRDLPGTAP
ncbi:GYD domain-containing protein [Chelatococcus sp. SYSU_G07232]|uniref:GYD domain-containing protein n=1 Tax=Chelatococcus albus TaxID=3047466 RepID=A0ABT7AE51_9HYPH|nr:GYD domain-containing protein [Chelatococcus sp. SYSU_G07232]MDJ1157639.1 GYD domain-containing protein [Chelatococcus sp. SYSU_G07232]